MAPCFLCAYSVHPVAQNVCTLINENIHMIQPTVLALQCSELLARDLRTNSDTQHITEGFSHADVVAHMQSHMTHANVVLSGTVRELVEIKTKLCDSLYSVDEDGCKTIDMERVRHVIAISKQLASMYKSCESGKLLFNKSRSETL